MNNRTKSRLMKGISPLIASVVLIAVTLAIAGILTTWSVQFVGQKGSNILKQSDCLGALSVDLDYIKFNPQTQKLAFIIRNSKNNIELDSIKAFLTYEDATIKDFDLTTCCNVSATIKPLGVASVALPTGRVDKPAKLELVATNCPDYKAQVFVP
ncbi:MAG: hypothetical protein HY831_04120 [Candidatus Aenigmarchaeota archaeon]|nr:hypothetical protein [Candidatus Aenigmarchaeota archaeon]